MLCSPQWRPPRGLRPEFTRFHRFNASASSEGCWASRFHAPRAMQASFASPPAPDLCRAFNAAYFLNDPPSLFELRSAGTPTPYRLRSAGTPSTYRLRSAGTPSSYRLRSAGKLSPWCGQPARTVAQARLCGRESRAPASSCSERSRAAHCATTGAGDTRRSWRGKRIHAAGRVSPAFRPGLDPITAYPIEHAFCALLSFCVFRAPRPCRPAAAGQQS